MCRLLNDLRQSAGLTNRGLSALLKKPHSYVYKVEHGERRIDPLEFIAWCRACGADPAEKLGSLERAR